MNLKWRDGRGRPPLHKTPWSRAPNYIFVRRRMTSEPFVVTKDTSFCDLRLFHVAEEAGVCPYTADERRFLPSDSAFTCIPKLTSCRPHPRVFGLRHSRSLRWGVVSRSQVFSIFSAAAESTSLRFALRRTLFGTRAGTGLFRQLCRIPAPQTFQRYLTLLTSTRRFYCPVRTTGFAL
jgi:hypothetical protein